MRRIRRVSCLLRCVVVVGSWGACVGAQNIAAASSEPVAGDGAEEDETRAVCGRAYEHAQEARAEGRLQEAEEALLVCAQAHCPAFVQTDCTQWLAEVKRDLPSVVVAAVAPNGEETVDVQVLVDGKVISEKLDGRAFPLDPGVHEFVFKYREQEPIRRRIVVRQGQQNRSIKISFEDKSPVKQVPSVKKAPSEDGPWVFQRYRDEIRIGSYIAAGLGAAGIGVGVGFWVSASAEENAFLDDCGDQVTSDDPEFPNQCSNLDYSDEADRQRHRDVIKSVPMKYDIGNISVIAGSAVLAVGVAAFLLTEPWADEEGNSKALLHDVTVGAAPIADGGYFSVQGRF